MWSNLEFICEGLKSMHEYWMLCFIGDRQCTYLAQLKYASHAGIDILPWVTRRRLFILLLKLL